LIIFNVKSLSKIQIIKDTIIAIIIANNAEKIANRICFFVFLRDLKNEVKNCLFLIISSFAGGVKRKLLYSYLSFHKRVNSTLI